MWIEEEKQELEKQLKELQVELNREQIIRRQKEEYETLALAIYQFSSREDSQRLELSKQSLEFMK